MLAYKDTCSSHSYYDYEDQKTGLFGDAIIILIPTLTFLEFRLVGRIFLSEIILIGLLPFVLFFKGWMLRDPLPKKLISLGLLWLFAQVITDLIRGTPFHDYARGWAKISFFLANFASLYMLLYDSKKRIALFVLGLAFSGFLAYKFNPSVYAAGHPWKFGVGPSITLVLILISTTTFVFHIRFLSTLIIALLAFVNLYMGFRSMAGICFLAAVYIFSQRLFVTHAEGSIKPSLKKVAFVFLLIIIGTVSFLALYSYAAENYWLGKKARYLYRSQSGSFGILMGGRGTLYSATRAVIDSPLIGHGSWAKNPYYIDVLKDLKKFGYTVGDLTKLYRSRLIPTHSHLLGSWVESGILGAVFWGWVLILTVKVLLNQYNIRDPLTPLIAYIGIRLVWDIIFSPFGAERRLTTAFFLVLLMFALYTPDDNPSVLSQ